MVAGGSRRIGDPMRSPYGVRFFLSVREPIHHILYNMCISTDILWRVFHSSMEPFLYTLVSVNRRNNEAPGHTLQPEPVPLKYGKLQTKYPWIYGHFYSTQGRSDGGYIGIYTDKKVSPLTNFY